MSNNSSDKQLDTTNKTNNEHNQDSAIKDVRVKMTFNEELALCIISALGRSENQLRAHVQGNLNVGNDKDLLINAITQCMPYMGFPRTLNAINCIIEIAK